MILPKRFLVHQYSNLSPQHGMEVRNYDSRSQLFEFRLILDWFYHKLSDVEILEFARECRKKYGPVYRFWMGFQLAVTFSDPEDVKVTRNKVNEIEKSL